MRCVRTWPSSGWWRRSGEQVTIIEGEYLLVGGPLYAVFVVVAIISIV